MKKKLFVSLLLALSLLLGVCACAHAEARLDYVTDAAGVLSEAERQALNDKAAQISGEYGCGVYIIVVSDYSEYVRSGGIRYFAEEAFDSYGLGCGDSHNGILLAMSMKDRDYDLYAHGDFGNYAFTDYGKKELAGTFLDNFRVNDWAGGFADFVSNSGSLLRLARGGKPMDVWIPDQTEEQPGLTPGKLLVSLLAGCLTGGVTVGGMKRKMKTAVKQTRAEQYATQGGVTLRRQEDIFVNRTVSRQVIRHDSPGGHGGPGSRPGGGHFGGTTISGGHGGSHHSGKF